MNCLDPYCTGGLAFPCGKCSPCLFNRRGVWAHRIMLEASCHAWSSFVTLTYRDETLPAGGNLEPFEARAFRKRLRSRVGPYRYFFCGEYSPTALRPHYHAVVFGPEVSPWFELNVAQAWDQGFVKVSPLTWSRASYISGYVLKKMHEVTPVELVPQFQCMSLKPGLGAHAPLIRDLVSSYGRHPDKFPDVLPYIKEGGVARPLGRYLTELIRKDLWGDEYFSLEAKEQRAQYRTARLRSSLQDVYSAAGILAKAEGSSSRSVVKRAIHQENYQRAVNQAARSKRNETL